MKKISLIIILAVVLAGISFFSFNQPDKQESEYLMMRAYEPVDAKSEIVLSYGNGQTERIPLKDLKSENHEYNVDLITNTLNRLSSEGYKVHSVASSGAGNPTSLVHVETYILVKN